MPVSEAESVAESGAADRDAQALQQVLSSRRISLEGGFLLVYDKNGRFIASFQAPSESTPVTLRTSMNETEQGGTPLRGPLSSASALRRAEN